MTRAETPSPVGPLARRDPEPVFDEPWQAQALAMAARLQERGLFTNAQWSQALGAELSAAAAAGEEDSPQAYYRAALRALEGLVAARTELSEAALAERVEAWREAYLRTPHGKPVVLEPDSN